MSLAIYASPFTNTETRKRQSSIKRSKKNVEEDNEDNEILSVSEHMQNPSNNKLQKPQTIEDMQTLSNERTTRVNDLLNQMSSITDDNLNNKMGEFQPIKPPSIQTKKDMESIDSERSYMPEAVSYLAASNAMKTTNEEREQPSYKANNKNDEKYGNYLQSYETQTTNQTKPYYANMGIGNNTTDSKLLDKINYMIHLLEEQQHEKTNNITEEFLLYTFLGVFIIYVVDSFARSGKYIR